MKKILPVLAMALVAITACTKSKNDTKPYNMTATIGGAAFSRDSCVFYFPDLADSTFADIYGWAGYPQTQPNYYPIISFDLFGYHGVGTYSAIGNGKLRTSDTSYELATSGTITITSIYPTVTGTFSFVTQHGVAVSGGSFRALRQ